MSAPTVFQPLRDVIAETAADLSNSNPIWTAGCLAAALIPALDEAGWQIMPPSSRADRPAPDRHELRAFQRGVDRWMDACFGQVIKGDQLERADRFIEEALELVQTMDGFSQDRAQALVAYVFNRPTGERFQEVGGVMVTLAALCNAVQLDMGDAAELELARVWTKVDAIRAKQAAKPTGSALPIAVQSDAADRFPEAPLPDAQLANGGACS